MREDVHRLMTDRAGHHFILRRRLMAVIMLTGIVAIVGAFAIYLLERHADGTEIHTYWSALFWTSAQLLTVSSQMKNPISAGGRALDIFFEMWAITVVAVLAGSLGSFFTHKSHMMTREREPDLINRPLPGGRPR